MAVCAAPAARPGSPRPERAPTASRSLRRAAAGRSSRGTRTAPPAKRSRLAQLAPGTGFAGGQTALQAPTVLAPAAAALDPSGGAQVLAATGVQGDLPNQFVAARRAAATGAFGTPAPVGTGSFVQIVSAAANARGDLAAVVSTGPRHAVLVTAAAGGAFGAPQDINPGGLAHTAAVGLGPDGALVVASYDGVSRALVRRGAVGGALGAPQALAQVRNRPDFSAAIDDDGTATVAFGRSLGRDGIGVAVARARSGAAFGAPVTLDRGPNAQVPQVAAAGSTTAVTWLSLTAARARPRRRRAGRGPASGARRRRRPAASELRGEAGRVPSEAGVPTVAVDRAGDVLLAYPYGPFNAVHETLLRAGSNRFVAPRILSALGHGGVPAAALTDDRRPIVAWADGDGVFAATGLGPAHGGGPHTRRALPRAAAAAPAPSRRTGPPASSRARRAPRPAAGCRTCGIQSAASSAARSGQTARRARGPPPLRRPISASVSNASASLRLRSNRRALINATATCAPNCLTMSTSRGVN